MITVNIRAIGGVAKSAIVEVTSTPREVFAEKGVAIDGTTINLSGTVLSASELDSSFEDLGIGDGDTISLNSIIKADGASL